MKSIKINIKNILKEIVHKILELLEPEFLWTIFKYTFWIVLLSQSILIKTES